MVSHLTSPKGLGKMQIPSSLLRTRYSAQPPVRVISRLEKRMTWPQAPAELEVLALFQGGLPAAPAACPLLALDTCWDQAPQFRLLPRPRGRSGRRGPHVGATLPRMRSVGAALAGLLLGTLGAFPKGHPLKATCAGDPSYYPDEAAGSCCYRCPSELLPTQSCPQGPAHCRKRCAPNHYLDEDRQCTACVRCVRDDLVEKVPCSWNSSRVCECRPGMYCVTSAVNSCARCYFHSACSAGMVVKFPGTAEKDTVCERPSPGANPDCSGPEDCRTPTSPITSQATPALTSPVSTNVKNMLPREGTRLVQEDAARLMRAPPPGPDAGPVLFWVTMVLLLLVGSSSFLLCYWKTCRRRVRQKLHLYYPAPSFQPKLRQTDKCRCWKRLMISGADTFAPALLLLCGGRGGSCSLSRDVCRYNQELRSASVTELGPGPLSMGNPPAVETCANTGAVCPETLPLQNASSTGSPLVPREPPESRVSTEHTNNKIEKIYIMKADTVIVGTVSAEAPESRVPAGPSGPELEVDLDVDHAPHYPQQETEPLLDSRTDVMFSVEEERKEDSWPTAASEK
uniref:tumor necrosis factor receptor superfamily member 8 n=1 Tax=Jaculus jaculus TaxID=51337 RepID=UPI001E1B02D8|nr:tumor necrosis factor receptor superfamily member 8 [Jaculus jaculus]